MSALLALGPYIFRILPLTLQKIEEETTANHPALQRFGSGPARQFTGPGESTLKIEGLWFNEEFGGQGDYLALKGIQAAGRPVITMGWGAGATFAMVLGRMVILRVSAQHEAIGPDGIGRKITFGIELASYGEDGGGGFFG
jgi:phage protein U